MSDNMRKFLIIIFFLALGLIFLRPVVGDGDLYHHLNAGKDILNNHGLSYHDSFTFTATGGEWVNYSWLSDILFHLINTYLGPIGLSIFIASIALATLVLAAVWLKSYKLPKRVILPVIALLAAALATRWPVRPEIFTYPCVIALLLIDQIRIKRPKLVLLFPVIILLWANLYGSGVILGVGLIFVLLSKQFYTDQFKLAKPQKLFYLLGLVAIIASLFNGYGFNSLFYIFNIQEIGQTQMEWFGILKLLASAPYAYLLSFQYHLMVYFLYAGALLALTIFNFKVVSKIKFEGLLALAIVVPLFAFRQFPLAAILAAPLLGLLIFKHVKAIQKKLIVTLSVISSIAIVIILWTHPIELKEPNQYPKSLLTFLEQYQLKGRVLNAPQDGGFLSYYFYPDLLIFADTRDELYLGTHILEDYYQAIATNKVPELLATYKIDYVLGDLAQGAAFKPLFYSQEWVPVYLGGRYFLAMRLAEAQAKNIPVLEYVDPFTFSQAKQGHEQDVLELYKSFAHNQDGSVDDQLRYAYTLYAVGKYNEAIAELESIRADQSPGNVLFNMSKDYLSALSYLNLNNCIKAKIYLDKTNQGIKGEMFFTSAQKMPSPVNKGYQLYSQVCTQQLIFPTYR